MSVYRTIGTTLVFVCLFVRVKHVSFLCFFLSILDYGHFLTCNAEFMTVESQYRRRNFFLLTEKSMNV